MRSALTSRPLQTSKLREVTERCSNSDSGNQNSWREQKIGASLPFSSLKDTGYPGPSQEKAGGFLDDQSLPHFSRRVCRRARWQQHGQARGSLGCSGLREFCFSAEIPLERHQNKEISSLLGTENHSWVYQRNPDSVNMSPKKEN